MKIDLPSGDSGKKKNNYNKSYKKKGNNINTTKKKKKTTTDWRVKKDNPILITAIISGTLVTIDTTNFNILFPNNFIIRCDSLEEAKKKAMDFFKD